LALFNMARFLSNLHTTTGSSIPSIDVDARVQENTIIRNETTQNLNTCRYCDIDVEMCSKELVSPNKINNKKKKSSKRKIRWTSSGDDALLESLVRNPITGKIDWNKTFHSFLSKYPEYLKDRSKQS